MSVMTSPTDTDRVVAEAIRDAGLTAEQERTFRGDLASWAFEGLVPDDASIRATALIAAGTIDVAEARRRTGG